MKPQNLAKLPKEERDKIELEKQVYFAIKNLLMRDKK